MRWIYNPPPSEEVGRLAGAAGVSPVVAELLIRAGVVEPAAVAQFLRPALAELLDPFQLPNLELAAKRLAQAVAEGESIVVLGDYDVDGVSSTALLVSVLRRFGLAPRFVVPRRAEDGYGLSRSAIDRALEDGLPDLFVALDCGTNSREEIAYLLSRQIDVLVIDHHRARDEAVGEGLLINPHVGNDDEVPETARDLCTVGLVFKLVHGLVKHLRLEGNGTAVEMRLREYLDLVALGTVADLVPLRGENRILARFGLQILRERRRPGVSALMEVAGIVTEQPISPIDISFRLGPRINASGRLADAALSVELLLSEDREFSSEVALQLDTFNRERQEIERQMTEEAEQMVEDHFHRDPGIVLYRDNWHPGVVGIVAGRVSRTYHRPCIVLGDDGELAKGSGRGVAGSNLVEILGDCAEHLVGWGGHPMAVGVSLSKSGIDDFRREFVAAIQRRSGNGFEEEPLEIATWIRPDEVEASLMDEIEALHPFGQGHPEPKFGIRGLQLARPPEVFKGRHFRFQVDAGGGRRLYGVAWKMADRLPPFGAPIDLAVELKWNHFNNRKLLQLVLVDWRPAQAAV